MTRDEFIEYYVRGRGVADICRTEDGYHEPGRLRRRAVPCDCGDEICLGWIMEYVDDEEMLNSPDKPIRIKRRPDTGKE